MALPKGVFVVAAKRTAFGAFGGKLKGYTANQLQVIANKAALAAGGVNPEIIDHVVVGNVIQSSKDAAYIARHSALHSGIPVPVGALTVNRLCGSGFQSVVNGTQDICMGDGEVVLCGGSENMSQAPFAVRDIRFGTKLGASYEFEDTLWEGLTDAYCKTPMGVTAENLAEKYGLTREDTDTYALQSQSRWKDAHDNGRFKDEIAPITMKSKKGEVVFDTDEHPRTITMEQLAKLPPVFKKNGTVTAGNASGVCDGAGALILASEDAVSKHNLTPLARVVGYSYAGVDPSIMGIGPAPAIRKLLTRTGKTLDDIDLVDVNEAFAPQFLAVMKELQLDPAKTNVNGGAIALGHPLGASGSRILANLVYELRHRQANLAIGAACIGGGQGIAVMLEGMK